jgi:tetratricopeptide (TPR) repeat protein
MRASCLAALLAALGLFGCAGGGFGLPPPPGRSFTLSQVVTDGDPARRASVRLAVQGIEADEAGDPVGAALLYDRSLQVDPTNPYAYLAYARHLVDEGDSLRALAFLDKAQAILADPSPALEAHLVGLRGAALAVGGDRSRAAPLLARAHDLDPRSWDDARLAPGELR